MTKCRSILNEVDDIEAVISSEIGQLKGSLQVNAPPVLPTFILPRICPYLLTVIQTFTLT